jgi:class 3 adenylate cyclase/pimeloyl-ACP methyl ester carboxylesterase
MEPQIRYTTTEDGASIAYGTLGAGPFVVYLPSVYLFPGHLRVVPGHRSLVERLAQHFTVVMYDGRGMGLSARDRSEYELDAKIRDLEAVLAAVGAETASLVGMQFGGLTAMAYAARQPQRVSSLVLRVTFTSGERFYQQNPVGRVLDALGAVTAEQWKPVTDMIGLNTVASNGGVDLQDVLHLGALLRETWSPDAFMAHRKAVRAIDVSSELNSIVAPTLVVTSSSANDLIEFVRELMTGIPNARGLRAHTHWGGWDDRDYAALIAFIQEHAGSVTSAPVAPRTSSVRTVLFTDLVGHTEMMHRLGDARGRDVLREHEQITRETMRSHGGTEIKTDGDSFMMSFGSVASAVECAVGLQRAFAAREGEPLHVRIGLNAGEPIEDDGDLFGSTVILAARIKDRAEAGEILVPDTVRGLLSGKGFVFADRGEFVPKGFEDGVRLFEVRWRE